jgi:hypothetical protein
MPLDPAIPVAVPKGKSVYVKYCIKLGPQNVNKYF